MKAILPLIAFFCFANTASAAKITAIQNGNWTAATTWDLNRVPLDGDEVVIPAGRQVNFTNSPYPQNNPTARPTLKIRIYGTLDFSSPGNDKLYLDQGSSIVIFAGGKIQTSSSSTEIISIYNGLLDNTVWIGTPSTISGPASATSTTLGFVNALLPAKLESFTVKPYDNGKAQLTWVTSTETNSSHFEIEAYESTLKTWEFVGTVNANGNTSASSKYSFITSMRPGENQFRLKQVDIDGKFAYSPIVSITYDKNGNVSIRYNRRNNQLVVENGGTSAIDVQVYDLSGNLVLSKKTSSVTPFVPRIAGVYIVRIANGNITKTSKLYIE